MHPTRRGTRTRHTGPLRAHCVRGRQVCLGRGPAPSHSRLQQASDCGLRALANEIEDRTSWPREADLSPKAGYPRWGVSRTAAQDPRFAGPTSPWALPAGPRTTPSRGSPPLLTLSDGPGGGLRRNVERDALTVKGALSKRISLSMTQPAPRTPFYNTLQTTPRSPREFCAQASQRLGEAVRPLPTRPLRERFLRPVAAKALATLRRDGTNAQRRPHGYLGRASQDPPRDTQSACTWTKRSSRRCGAGANA
jgi:hypothetical protein